MVACYCLELTCLRDFYSWLDTDAIAHRLRYLLIRVRMF